MLASIFANTRTQAVALLLAGTVGLLIAALALTQSLLSDHIAAPGRRALGHWLPVAVMVLVAAVTDQVPLATSIIFGSSVVCLSVVTGFVILAGPLIDIPAAAQRIWPFLPVPALLAFIVGFRGSVGPYEAGLLVLQGLLAWLIWTEPLPPHPAMDFPDHHEGNHPADSAHTDAHSKHGFLVAEIIAALAVAAVAGWAASRGVAELSDSESHTGISALAGAAISATLIMPMIITGTSLAAAGRAWAPLSGQIGLVLLNIGVLLPATILLPEVIAWVKLKPWAGPVTQPVWDIVLYPRLSWRIDAVALLIVSLLFVPVSQGKVRLDRYLAVWLIAAYCIYLLGMLALAVRP